MARYCGECRYGQVLWMRVDMARYCGEGRYGQVL